MTTPLKPASAAASPAPARATVVKAGAETVLTTPQHAAGAPATPVNTPGHLLGDADVLYAANTLGLAEDLGLTPGTGAVASPAGGSSPEDDEETQTDAGTETEEEGTGGEGEAEEDLPPAETPGEETPAERVARLERELAEARGETLPASEAVTPAGEASGAQPPAAPLVVPTAANPLANLRTNEHFAVAEQSARSLKEWAYRNRDGGSLPPALLQQIENAEAVRTGRAPRTVSEPQSVDADTAATLYTQAERMLEQDLPARRQFVGAEQQALGLVRQSAPRLLDAKAPEGQFFQRFTQSYPQLMQSPEWPLIVRDLVTGYLANNPDAAKKAGAKMPAAGKKTAATVKNTKGQDVPFAGSAPVGGAAPAAPSYSQREVDGAYERLRKGKASEKDLSILGAAAV